MTQKNVLNLAQIFCLLQVLAKFVIRYCIDDNYQLCNTVKINFKLCCFFNLASLIDIGVYTYLQLFKYATNQHNNINVYF